MVHYEIGGLYSYCVLEALNDYNMVSYKIFQKHFESFNRNFYTVKTYRSCKPKERT